MKITPLSPPRTFPVGDPADPITLTHTHDLHPEPDEQVTFHTESGAEYDVVRKAWGFYATPSINGRLARFGLKTALIENPAGQRYVVLVEAEKQAEFEGYLAAQKARVVAWM